MASAEVTFDQRLRRLVRKHRRMNENGVVHRVGPDGLMTAYPRRRLPRFPLRAVLILLAVAFLFKAWVLTSLGAAAYEARVAAIAEGSPAERVAAWVMAVDPLTETLAAQMARLGL